MGKHHKKGGGRRPQIVDHVSDSEDEEIPEDEAFNSDDERKYGSFFHDDDDEDESDEEEEGDDEEESEEEEDDDDDDEDSQDGDGGKYMLDLLNKLDDDNDKDKNEEKKAKSIAPHVKESQFSSSVIQKAGLTLDNLMDGLEDTKGFGLVQKAMKKVSQGQATAAPVAKVVSNRAERKVHYQLQCKEVSQWSQAVHENRKAETLDFRPKQRLEVTRDVLIDKFVPTTDFEKDLHKALQEAGQEDEEAMLKAEEDALHDDLGANEITMDEFKKRRGQLAKMRALMFSYEQKRHHINKIKSKKYRRIRKKQRERLKDAETEAQMEENPDLARELQEKEEMERMKERASLAHKNTSKWAKRILKRGKNVDVDTRRALSAQLKRGDDLLQRMNSTSRGAGDDDDSDDEDLVETARKVLEDTEDDATDPNEQEANGLFKLSFMQRGVERQRQKAKEEARQLLMELEANEEQEDSEEDDDAKAEQEKTTKKKKPKTASKEEMKQVLNDGEMVASSLKFGTSNAVAVSGSINIDEGFHEDNDRQKNEKEAAGDRHVYSTTLSSGDMTAAKASKSPAKPSKPTQQQKKKRAAQSTPSVAAQQDEANPWLATAEKGETVAADDTTSKPAKQVKKRKNASSNKRAAGFVDVDRAVDLLDSTPAAQSTNNDKTAPAPSSPKEAPPERKITALTQEELVRKAFAAASDNAAEEEFAKEKAIIEEREDPTRKMKKEKDMGESSGWGSWAGKGAPPPRPPRKFPKKLQPPEKQKVKRKRMDEKKPGVIISQKRVKKMADKFMLQQIPYPFTTREDYERSMTGSVGREWNVTSSFKDMTRPEIYTRAGKVIQPISKKVKQKRAPAKF